MVKFWTSKKVLITGHSGFKGSWLSLILKTFGAEVYGISLKPEFKPNLYELIQDKLDLKTKEDFVLWLLILKKNTIMKIL